MQEILGVNGHIRFIADGFAQDGYRVIAPALFDRLERAVSLSYTPAGHRRRPGADGSRPTESACRQTSAAT